jgi:hypothetical protein
VKKFGGLFFIAIALIFICGCALARRPHPKIEGETPSIKSTDSRGDAYLYDLTIVRKGKKNSLRLDLYHFGDTLSFFARGYLGKGVMKGLLTPDSLFVYFPTEDEYFAGNIEELADNRCLEGNNVERTIISLFSRRPSEAGFAAEGFYVVAIREADTQCEYRLQSGACPEGIRLLYDFQGGKFAIKECELKTGNKAFNFRAVRRRWRLGANIPREKKELIIPESAVPIFP